MGLVPDRPPILSWFSLRFCFWFLLLRVFPPEPASPAHPWGLRSWKTPASHPSSPFSLKRSPLQRHPQSLCKVLLLSPQHRHSLSSSPLPLSSASPFLFALLLSLSLSPSPLPSLLPSLPLPGCPTFSVSLSFLPFCSLCHFSLRHCPPPRYPAPLPTLSASPPSFPPFPTLLPVAHPCMPPPPGPPGACGPACPPPRSRGGRLGLRPHRAPPTCLARWGSSPLSFLALSFSLMSFFARSFLSV